MTALPPACVRFVSIACVVSCLLAPRWSEAATVQHLWSGEYSVSDSREIDDPAAPRGKRYVSSAPKLERATHKITARIGIRFGVGFIFRGAPTELVTYRVVWRHPALTNPDTERTTIEYSQPATPRRAGEPVVAGVVLDRDWLLVPGTWTVEIWLGLVKALEESFEVSLP